MSEVFNVMEVKSKEEAMKEIKKMEGLNGEMEITEEGNNLYATTDDGLVFQYIIK